jgi:hypoxanthine-DNA glycosylase
MPEPMREGLPPVITDGARVLLLGSFPSERSLIAGEYYANRRNQFWPLMAALFDFDAELPYSQRITALTDRGIALWDVVHSCRRAGSMDVKIDRKTLVSTTSGRC